jgi:hypothetical protein
MNHDNIRPVQNIPGQKKVGQVDDMLLTIPKSLSWNVLAWYCRSACTARIKCNKYALLLSYNRHVIIKYVTIKCYIIILGQNETDNLTANASS